jgi:DNA-binding response OmpR family regulator
MADILLIEPDRLLAETYLQALAAAGYSVGACSGAQAAVLVADQTRPDLVVLELQLTTHSGIEFLYEFRSYPDWQDIPVVVHSQVPKSEFQQNWQLLKDELGVKAYLYKPQTTLRQLVATVNEQLPVKA